MRALLIPADPINKVVDVDIDVDAPGSHKALAKMIGADSVELVRSTVPGVALIIDEAGLLRAKPAPANYRASNTLMVSAVVGDVLAVSTGLDADGQPDIADLTAEHRAAVMRAIDLAEGRAEMRSAIEMYEQLNGVMAFFVYRADEGIYIRQTSTEPVSGLVTLAVTAGLEEIARNMRAGLAQALADEDGL